MKRVCECEPNVMVVSSADVVQYQSVIHQSFEIFKSKTKRKEKI